MGVAEGLAGPDALLRGLVQTRQAPRLGKALGVREGLMLVLRPAGPVESRPQGGEVVAPLAAHLIPHAEQSSKALGARGRVVHLTPRMPTRIAEGLELPTPATHNTYAVSAPVATVVTRQRPRATPQNSHLRSCGVDLRLPQGLRSCPAWPLSAAASDLTAFASLAEPSDRTRGSKSSFPAR